MLPYEMQVELLLVDCFPPDVQLFLSNFRAAFGHFLVLTYGQYEWKVRKKLVTKVLQNSFFSQSFTQ